MGLVYIAGYIIGKDENGDNADDSHFYCSKYGSFSRNLNRGGMHLPGDKVCQWVVYGYIMFNEVVNDYCKKLLAEVESSRTHFEVLGLGLEASSPQKLACPRLEDSTIF